jgi:hypothetical protein
MQNGTQRLLDELRKDWPDWRIWIIWPAVGPVTWHAHPPGDERHVIHASSCDELAWEIEQREGS